ncbi:SMI1/KNR4 family protein [Paenibacillus bovis]|uniref:Knr4/Smi1-like domain-containing protein n=1 Tax=Paenibacillus bovis TaxID=1616788 RepID=A0A172ZC47_9BACL|nr:SMI1/KNR4 family protein [Paenibacillus bovis]ANF95083.1 hypothetical protein AR543_02870 [Paenibacillus bovis]
MNSEWIEQLNRWHNEEEYERIVKQIEQVPAVERNYELTGQLARAYNNLERYREALELLLSTASEGQDDYAWHFRLGYAYSHLAQYDKALTAFEQANRLQPEDEYVQEFLSSIRPYAHTMEQDRQRYEQETALWKQQHGEQLPFSSFDLSDFWEDSEYAVKDHIEPPFDEEMIRSIEQELGYKLPASYIALMHTQNGGFPARTAFPTAGATSWANDHVAITSISGIGGQKSYSLTGDMGSRFMIEQWGYPDLGIVFGDCPSAGHDVIMLDYRFCGPTGEPAVVHVDQENDYEITYLAPHFEAFICGLVDAEELEI